MLTRFTDVTVDKLLLKYAGANSNEMPSDGEVRKFAQELMNENGSFGVDPELGDLEKVKAQLDRQIPKRLSRNLTVKHSVHHPFE